MAPPPPASAGILEITLDSAQDLFPVSKKMKTYAVVWLQHDESNKQATNVDQAGGANPTWNHKFTFRADEKFLNSADAAISVEICAASSHNDDTIGCVNVPMKDIIEFPPAVSDATGIFSVQLRRPSGRSQGVLNMEVSLTLTTTEDISGSMVGGSMCNSDIGPSASVVAEAIAIGLYKPEAFEQDQSQEATEIKEWTKKEREKAAAERRAMGSSSPGSMVLPPDPDIEPRSLKGKKLFSFMGLEIAVTFGGGGDGGESNKKKKNKKKHGGGGNKVHNLSSADKCSK